MASHGKRCRDALPIRKSPRHAAAENEHNHDVDADDLVRPKKRLMLGPPCGRLYGQLMVPEGTLSKRNRWDVRFQDLHIKYHNDYSTDQVPITELRSFSNPTYDNGASDIVQRTSLLSLPTMIKEMIFGYIIPVNSKVAPTWARGMLIQGIQGSVYDDINVASKPNMDLSLIRVNKELKEEVAKILYGRNRYIFIKAGLCYWWLTRIGKTNVGYLRTLIVDVYSGFDYLPTSVFACSYEEVWARIFLFLQHQQNLHTLRITLFCWRDLNDHQHQVEAKVPRDKVEEVVEARLKVIEFLSRLRGIQEATILQRGCHFLSKKAISTMILVMQQAKSAPAPPRAKMSIEMLMHVLKHRRENKATLKATRRRINSYRLPRVREESSKRFKSTLPTREKST